MTLPLASRVGGVLSADIAVPDHAREIDFYRSILTTGDRPFWRDDLMNQAGMPVIGLGARTDQTAHLPVQWMPHFQVSDVAESTGRAVALGARVLMRHEANPSTWAVIADPNGAVFGLIPVVPEEHLKGLAELDVATLGRIVWLDLTVVDADSTRDFYREVVGFSVFEIAMDGGSYADYAMLGGDNDGAAGVCHARGTNLGLPPVWLIYLPVGDLVESMRRVTSGGGQVLKEMPGPSGTTAHAVIVDPVGAVLVLSQG